MESRSSEVIGDGILENRSNLRGMQNGGSGERMLLFDTCGEGAGIALSLADRVVAAVELPRSSASAEIISATHRLLVEGNCTLAELDAIGVVSGPGSFTGVRVGMAVAKGLAEALQVRMLTVSRLGMLARAAGLHDGWVVLGAGRNGFYAMNVINGNAGSERMLDVDSIAKVALGNMVVVAEPPVAALLESHVAGVAVRLHSLYIGDALSALREAYGASARPMTLDDANYLLQERDIYKAKSDQELQNSAPGLDFTLRQAVMGDLSELMQLQSTVKLWATWSEALWMRLLDQSIREPQFRCIWLAEVAGRVIGFAVLGSVLEVAELEQVVVASQMRQAGVGRALCEAAISSARSHGATRVELEVRASNHAALRLYAALGFAEQGIRRDYYLNPLEDAVLLGVTLHHEEWTLPKV